jgi:hypothetical protein
MRHRLLFAPVIVLGVIASVVALARCDEAPPRLASVTTKAAAAPGLPHLRPWRLPTTTTSTSTTTTTRPAPPPTPPTTARQAQQRVSRSQGGAPAPSTGPRFWRRLSNCESRNGADEGPYGGYFQMTSSSWANGGGTGGWAHGSWEDQQRVAAAHAAKSNPWKQWPQCWGRALGDDPRYD